MYNSIPPEISCAITMNATNANHTVWYSKTREQVSYSYGAPRELYNLPVINPWTTELPVYCDSNEITINYKKQLIDAS